MKRLLFVLFVLSPAVALSSERIRMVDNASQVSVKDTLENVCRAFDSENLDLFESCFAESRRKQVRRRYAMVFVKERCSMQLLESHVIEMGEMTAEAAVRYKMSDSYGTKEVVSRVNFVKQNDKWLIDSENMVSKSACGGSSPVAPARPNPRNQPEDPDWDPMNPDPSRVSPNLQDLIGDIGIQPGMGCANGRCPGGRCPVR